MRQMPQSIDPGVAMFGLLQADLPLDQLRSRWAPAPSQFIALMGMQVHLRDEGPREDPSPIVLIHGTAASLHTWEGWVDALKPTRRVVTMDLPGFGLTGPNPEDDYHLDTYVRFVLALLDRLGIQRCVLGGNSLGGEIAWHVGLAAPQRIERLILVDAAGYKKWPKGMPLGFLLAALPGSRPIIERVLPRFIVDSSTRFVYGEPSRITAAINDRYYQLALRPGNRGALARRFRQVNMGEDTHRLGELRMPTLIVWGARDRIFGLGDARGFQKAIPGSRLQVYDDLGHVPQEEDAARTVRDVQAFLAA
jgi:pimeloyl-ACP methyl ester carboxylesterase